MQKSHGGLFQVFATTPKDKDIPLENSRIECRRRQSLVLAAQYVDHCTQRLEIYLPQCPANRVRPCMNRDRPEARAPGLPGFIDIVRSAMEEATHQSIAILTHIPDASHYSLQRNPQQNQRM